ncbi:MAG: alpha/beta fold hydrolase [Gammaproteobacteria bacterium]
MLATVEHDQEDAVGSVVWLHGLGADGHDFEPLIPEIGLKLRYVFPHAPVRPVTLNGGLQMRAWFDLYSSIRDARVDEVGIAEARASVTALIDREVERGMPAGKIVVAGFSQGGALALATGLAYPSPLAAIVSLSAWLPPAYANAAAAQIATPIFIGHGAYDQVVSSSLGRATHAALVARGCAAEWHEYPMEHQVAAKEIADLRVFLTRVFA